ncbi:hypothetical protein [Georgenia sp. Z1491]|uniref:hypothetical protein n=1 Tax=Georgenia sp. Z1491 TaxID=3416707 RepID=UPI003CFA8B60
MVDEEHRLARAGYLEEFFHDQDGPGRYADGRLPPHLDFHEGHLTQTGPDRARPDPATATAPVGAGGGRHVARSHDWPWLVVGAATVVLAAVVGYWVVDTAERDGLPLDAVRPPPAMTASPAPTVPPTAPPTTPAPVPSPTPSPTPPPDGPDSPFPFPFPLPPGTPGAGGDLPAGIAHAFPLTQGSAAAGDDAVVDVVAIGETWTGPDGTTLTIDDVERDLQCSAAWAPSGEVVALEVTMTVPADTRAPALTLVPGVTLSSPGGTLTAVTPACLAGGSTALPSTVSPGETVSGTVLVLAPGPGRFDVELEPGILDDAGPQTFVRWTID